MGVESVGVGFPNPAHNAGGETPPYGNQDLSLRPTIGMHNTPTEVLLMKPKSQPRRRATRLRDYDYGQTGGYFITICVQNQKCLFGKIVDGRMQLSEIGKTVVECWNRIPQHFFSVELDMCVVMPNHIHGIIVLNTVGARFLARRPFPQPNRRGEVPSSPQPMTQEHIGLRRGWVSQPLRFAH